MMTSKLTRSLFFSAVLVICFSNPALSSPSLEYWTIARCAAMISSEFGAESLQKDWNAAAAALLEQQDYPIERYEAIQRHLEEYLAKSELQAKGGGELSTLRCFRSLEEPEFVELMVD